MPRAPVPGTPGIPFVILHMLPAHASEHRPAVRAPCVVRPAPVESLRPVTFRAFRVARYAALKLDFAETHHAVRSDRGAQGFRERVGDEG